MASTPIQSGPRGFVPQPMSSLRGPATVVSGERSMRAQAIGACSRRTQAGHGLACGAGTLSAVFAYGVCAGPSDRYAHLLEPACIVTGLDR